MRPRIFLLGLFIWISVAGGWANQYSFLIADLPTAQGAVSSVAAFEYSIYIDPLKTNWIGWSQFETPCKFLDRSVIDQEYPGNIGVRDYMRLTITDPQQRESGRMIIDRNDKYGNSYTKNLYFHIEKMQ